MQRRFSAVRQAGSQRTTRRCADHAESSVHSSSEDAGGVRSAELACLPAFASAFEQAEESNHGC